MGGGVMEWLNRCHFGDVRAVLRRMAADDVKVQTIVTSPPYWGLRSYLPADHPDKPREIGSEPTLREFINNMVEVFELCRQVLRDDGTMWVNMGDSYMTRSNGPAQANAASLHGDRAHKWKEQHATRSRGLSDGLKNKDLVGQPWRLAFALQDAGWWLRQEIIWHKPNPMPESPRDRCTKSHEQTFLLAKSESYYFDVGAIAEKAIGGTPGNSKPVKGAAEDPVKHRTRANLHEMGASDVRRKRSVWTVATQGYGGAHFAVFPPDLIQPCILAGAAAGGIVLDPFFGSGTTGQVAQQLGRHFIGIELNEANEPLQRERLRQQSLLLERTA